jgi:hypothetical protein
MQTAQKLKTTKDLLAIPDENFKVYELLEGEIFLSEHPSLNHQKIVGNLIFLLDRFLLENPVGKFERISQIASGIHIVGAPDLAIEIMSPGSENVRRDQIVKRQTYAKYGVKEYWIVEPIVEVIEITRLQENVLASVGVFRNKDEINSPLLPDLNFTVKDVFRK